jgi:hypothetical protein
MLAGSKVNACFEIQQTLETGLADCNLLGLNFKGVRAPSSLFIGADIVYKLITVTETCRDTVGSINLITLHYVKTPLASK